ncbi:MAG: hypothetical protein RR618_09985 [Cellulosilyticaceae bacterium]
MHYNLSEEQSENYFSCGYPASELSNLMDEFGDKTYILIEDKLYKEFKETSDEESSNSLVSQAEVEKIEKLNEEFRDALISSREYLYHGGSALNSEEAKAVRATMNGCINEAKEILNESDIKGIEQLKKMSKKHFIAEFLEGLFGNEIYHFEDHIDCGL